MTNTYDKLGVANLDTHSSVCGAVFLPAFTVQPVKLYLSYQYHMAQQQCTKHTTVTVVSNSTDAHEDAVRSKNFLGNLLGMLKNKEH